MTYLIRSDAALARTLGVARSAVQKAEADGKIERAADGAWDLFDVVRRWRDNTWSLLQRPRRAQQFRPWLDCSLPLRGSLLVELERRAVAEGAERVDDGWDDDDEGGGDFDEDLALEDLEEDDDGDADAG
jgi:hypothetical protein